MDEDQNDTGHERALRLVSSEPPDAWDAPAVTLMSPVVVGERSDLAWAECEPPLRIGDHAHPIVLLQARDRSESVWRVDGGAVEVYVCTTAPESMAQDRVPRNHVKVLAWGILDRAR